MFTIYIIWNSFQDKQNSHHTKECIKKAAFDFIPDIQTLISKSKAAADQETMRVRSSMRREDKNRNGKVQTGFLVGGA